MNKDHRQPLISSGQFCPHLNYEKKPQNFGDFGIVTKGLWTQINESALKIPHI